jgi:hypothetical protein
MIAQKFHIIDDSGIKWWMPTFEAVYAQPFCVLHSLPLTNPPYPLLHTFFKCTDCKDSKTVSRPTDQHKKYVADKLRAKEIAKMEVIDHNGILVPVAKAKDKSGEYSITAQIMESKHGKQVVIYAGKKGYKNTQIFVDTENHKLAFDHKDTSPTDIFTKIEATFKNGTKMAIEAEPEA